LLLLYLLIPGAAAIGLLAFNPWFVQAWLGPAFYAGDYVSGLLALNLVAMSLAGGLFKVAGVVGYRVPIGVASIAGGLVAVGLGYTLGIFRGQAGVAEASLMVSLGVLLPYGLFTLGRIYGIAAGPFLRSVVAPWAIPALVLMAVASWAGVQLAGEGLPAVAAAVFGLLAAYALAVRPILGRMAWPAGLDRWLRRLRMIPAKRASLPSQEILPRLEPCKDVVTCAEHLP
jgi:hypothetical protein